MSGGRRIVLTADRILMADYRLLFDGMLAASQTTLTPSFVMNRLLAPRSHSRDGRAPVAPLGLRRIEAALVAGGLSSDDVAVVDEEHLAAAIGPETRIVAVSSGEPCGLGMSSTTMTGIAGGRVYPQVMLRRLLRRARALVDRHAPQARLVIGGSGMWQMADADDSVDGDLAGVDHVVTGYAEGNVAEVFAGLMSGDEQPRIIAGRGVDARDIPTVRGASTMGVVEISRGCGLGCEFCTIGREKMQHLPAETILADAQTNIAAGMNAIAILSEDCFRYGGALGNVAPDALIGLLERLRELPELALIQVDHANIMSIAQMSDDELVRVRELLVGDSGCEFPWVNVGVESASGELLAQAGGRAKMLGTQPEDWGEVCATQVRRIIAAGWLPMVSLMLGLSGESAEDLSRTHDWVRDMRRERVTIFPVVYAPIDGGAPPELTKAHWRLIRECYDLNFRWTPLMYDDNQRAVGVPLARRTLMQAMGKAQVLQWKTLLALRKSGAAS